MNAASRTVFLWLVPSVLNYRSNCSPIRPLSISYPTEKGCSKRYFQHWFGPAQRTASEHPKCDSLYSELSYRTARSGIRGELRAVKLFSTSVRNCYRPNSVKFRSLISSYTGVPLAFWSSCTCAPASFAHPDGNQLAGVTKWTHL